VELFIVLSMEISRQTNSNSCNWWSCSICSAQNYPF